MLTHGSLFTGIAGFDLGFAEAGIETQWSSEIDKYCNRVLATRYPEVPNLGDVTTISRPARVDVLSFGSPCQDLSVAGRRKGLEGARSGLFFEACRVIDECKPTLAVWENVPGGFTSNAGLDFRQVLVSLAELGCRSIAWRVFDSQYTGVPQRRRRVYLVADFGGLRAGEILFEPEGCSGHPSPFGPAGQGLAATLAAGAPGAGRPGGSHDTDLVVAPTLRSGPPPGGPGHGKVNGSDRGSFVVETAKAVMAREGKGIAFRGSSMMGNYRIEQAPALTAGSPGHSGGVIGQDGGQFLVIQDARTGIGSKGQNGVGAVESDVAYTLDTLATQAVALQPRYVVFDGKQVTSPGHRGGGPSDVAGTLNLDGQQAFAQGYVIRRYTPLECERLQGFPDGWTCLCQDLGEWARDPHGAMDRCSCPDGPRYRACGNAVSTTVPRWLGFRIQEVLS